MFELSILRKYLIPARKRLSVALIATVSVAVISLVVWLVIVFLSVTDGLEKTWLSKMTSLNAPLRLTPTKAYFDSYYYKIDTLSARSDFRSKSIGEKAAASQTDPYDPLQDAELPQNFPAPLRTKDGSLLDPVKEAVSILSSLQQKQTDLTFQPYELSGAMLKLKMIRPDPEKRAPQETVLTQASYLASFSEKSPHIKSLIENPSATLFGALPSKERGIVLAKQYKDSGVKIGDRGVLLYQALQTGSVQEQRLPVYVSGFYDPGIMAVGNRCILVSPEIARTINTASPVEHFDRSQANGFQVWLKSPQEAKKVQAEIQKALKDHGIDTYWKVITYHDYDFAKDLLQQFQSDRYLFTLISLIILIVASGNIVSMLVLLVNDKKKEIGILQAMGATKKSIACIFGGVGFSIGILSCAIGVIAALFTLANLESLVHLLSALQGHDAFNAAFFGASLPNEISWKTLTTIGIATPLIALLAGLIPGAIACRLNPSQILRSE